MEKRWLMQCKNEVKRHLGGVFSHIYPSRAELIERNFALPYFEQSLKMDFVDRQIRAYLSEKLTRSGGQAVENNHREFWCRQGRRGWYGAAAGRCESIYRPAFEPFVGCARAEAQDRQITTLVELGAGDGEWLQYLSAVFPSIETFIGIDIAKEQICENSLRFRQLTFVAADIVEWITRNATDHTLYHTNSGVLEYLSEESVYAVLEAISRTSRSTVFLIEPVDRKFNLSADKHSSVLGAEFSFSHNYPYMLENLGFNMVLSKEIDAEGYRTLVLIADTAA